MNGSDRGYESVVDKDDRELGYLGVMRLEVGEVEDLQGLVE